MKNLNLNMYGVQEMNAEETKENSGGYMLVPVTLSDLARWGRFAYGFGCGILGIE